MDWTLRAAVRDSSYFATYSREARCNNKKNILVQPIAPCLPGEQLEGGNSLLLPGPRHSPGGETQPATALCQHSRSLLPHSSTGLLLGPTGLLLGPTGLTKPGKALLPQSARSRAPRLFHTRKMPHNSFIYRQICHQPSILSKRPSPKATAFAGSSVTVCVTFRFTDRVSRTENKQQGCVSSQQPAGREGTQLKKAQQK